ncbi:hypothetical protein [Kitasatospora sp. NBC_01539]|uniref:hypothetical protein n=1 Tax=Kitasatospora sp. NBC_01539 TaxID=2903577 RepID=UPI003860143C
MLPHPGEPPAGRRRPGRDAGDPADDARRLLAAELCTVAPPTAWSLDEVPLPGGGAGRPGSRRLALATALVHPQDTLPVNWRLLLPGGDPGPGPHGPAHPADRTHHRPAWRYALESVDEVLDGWGLPVAPVLGDGRSGQRIEPLLGGLEERGLGYLLRADATTPLPVGPRPDRPAGCHGRGAAHHPGTHHRPAADVSVSLGGHTERAVLPWQDGPDARPGHTRFLVAPLCAARPGHRGHRRGSWASGLRHLLLEWPLGSPGPRSYWVTNLPAGRLPDMVTLAALRHRTGHGCERLHEDYRPGHHAGPAHGWWHHHVTRVTAARAGRLLQRLRTAPAPERRAPTTGRPGPTRSAEESAAR